MIGEISDLVQGPVPAMPQTMPPLETRIVKNGCTLSLVAFEELDKDLIRQIIESGFGEKLVPDYFVDKKKAKFLVEEEGKGVAILLGNYLDILAVAKPHQSNGIGKALMEASLELSDNKLYWRSRPERVEINQYYGRLSKPRPFVSGDRINYNGYFVGYNQEEIPPRLLRMGYKKSNFQQTI